MFDAASTRALLLTLAAALSTLIGACIIFLKNAKSEATIAGALGLSAGVMASVSLTELLVEARDHLSEALGGQWGVLVAVGIMLGGIVLSLVLDRLLHRAEHGRHHLGHLDCADGRSDALYHVGFVSMLALMLHNIPEGIATFMAGYDSAALGVTLALAITLHNIPVGVSVALPIYAATGSRKRAFGLTLLSAMAAPVGALIAYMLLRPFITEMVMACMFALIAGILLYITFCEVLPSSRAYGHDKLATCMLFVGLCIMPITAAFAGGH